MTDFELSVEALKTILNDALTNNELSSGIFAKITGVGVQIQALDMGTQLINNVVDPVGLQDAATKKYVDDQDALQNQLSELTDVTITSRTANQALVVNPGNTSWINALIVDANISPTAAIVMSKIIGTKAQFDTALSNDDFAYIGQANVFTQNQEIKKTGAIPILTFDRPEVLVDNTTITRIDFKGFDDASASETYAQIRVVVASNAAANPEGCLDLRVDEAGTLKNYITLNDLAGADIDLRRPVNFNSQNASNMGTLNTHTVPGGTSTFAIFTDNLSVFAGTTKAQFDTLLSDDNFAFLNQANLFGDFDQTFKDNRILIESPDGLTPITIINSQQTLARNLTIPILTANDTIAVKGLDNAFSVGQTITGDVDVTGNVSVSGVNRIELGGAGSDTYWREGAADRAELFVGGVEQISASTAQIILNLPVAVLDANSQVSLFTSRIDTGVTGNTVSNLSHRGDDTADTNVVYAQTKTVIRDATPGSINGSYQIRVAENDLSNTSDKTLYMEFHGLNADIDVLKDLDMAADILLGTNDIFFNTAALKLSEVEAQIVTLTISDDVSGAGFKVANNDGSIYFLNDTGVANQFAPQLRGDSKGSARVGLELRGRIAPADDTGLVPVLVLDGRQNDNTVLVNRELLALRNNGADKWLVNPEGIIDYKGTMGNSSKAPQTVAPDDWVEIKIGGTIHFLPAYLA